ncbi:MAG: hypothetical protein M5R36_21085 [Deltaproteobacteria bacterium]|nr:hypothetical protein [Deltaproteobacteria bacterium]
MFTREFRMDTGCAYPLHFDAVKPMRRGGKPPWAWDDIDDEGFKIGEWFFLAGDRHRGPLVNAATV